MDGERFDAWVRTLRTRRGAVQALVGMGVALAIPPRPAGAVEKCLASGSACDPSDAGACCSGICRKRKGKHKGKRTAACAKGEAAFGCTRQDDICSGPDSGPCPGTPDLTDSFCVNTNQGKPLCAASGVCGHCKTDADCVDDLGPGARCIKRRRGCKEVAKKAKSLCVVPASLV